MLILYHPEGPWMTMSLEAAAQAMREAMRETVKRHSLWYLIQGALMVLGGVLALVYPIVSSVAVVLFLGWLLIISGAGHKSDRRSTRAAFLAPVDLRCLVGDRWSAFRSAAWRRSSCHHAPADRVFHGLGHFETRLCPDHTALSKLGLGFGKRRHRDTAVPFSVGQSSSDGNLLAWRPARHSSHL
jgi:hypothetical protein